MGSTRKSNPTSTSAANRLSGETSPYLLQHAYNPVDWYPWGKEALEKSKKEDKPILISIGYAACHWCHVMEHESFEDEDTAAIMNEDFVSIKVDREERPDLDEIYMKAVQMMTGHGGWPMTVFLTPELKPFFGGTYFPKEDRYGMPSFKRVLSSVAKAWKEQRQQVEQSSSELTNYLRQFDKAERSELEPDKSIIDSAVSSILKAFDQQWGGLGSAPKFPHTASLDLSMRYLSSPHPETDKHEKLCLEFVETTLNRMAYGGMHDQIGGGFARYSVDRMWLVPHFEKMLYDNATLSKIYLDGYLLTSRKYWADVAKQCLDFVLRELCTEDGAFYCSLDADSEGEEGKFYAWKPDEIIAVLGQQEGQWVNEVYGVTSGGNFEHATSVLHLSDSPEGLAKQYGLSVEAFWDKLKPLNEKLLAAREQRVRPGRDEKVLTSWNGLMISSFVAGWRTLQDERYLQAARDAANFILSKMVVKNRLMRTWGQGKAKLNAYLDDYAFFVQALLDLAAADLNPKWLKHAIDLNQSMLEHFFDDAEGSFYYTSDDHEELLTRPKSYFDGSIPSGTSVAVFNLLRLAKLEGQGDHLNKCESIFKLYAPHFARIPDQFSNLICALDFHLSAGNEIVLFADGSQNSWLESFKTLSKFYLPNAVMLLKDIGSKDTIKSPMLKGRKLIDDKTTVYICQNYTCQEPITDVSKLDDALVSVCKR